MGGQDGAIGLAKGIGAYENSGAPPELREDRGSPPLLNDPLKVQSKGRDLDRKCSEGGIETEGRESHN